MTRPSPKLGLSLAGGGFRASLFHLGVLHRLAELDLLRRVELLSTVSGGSITGLLYVLLLKRELEAKGELSRRDYVDLVRELDDVLSRGVRLNLRTRLILNPLGVLLTLISTDSLGRRMGRVYERYLIERILRTMPGADERPWWRKLFTPGRVRLGDLKIRPRDQDFSRGLDAYNAEQRSRENGSAITGILVNATTLNSGGRFCFSAVEVGDWYLGSFRRDELDALLARKHVLQTLPDEELSTLVVQGGGYAVDPEPTLPPRVVALAWWWRRIRQRAPDEAAEKIPPPAGWEPLFDALALPGALASADLGRLRAAKLAAWYLTEGVRRKITGDREPHEHRTRFLAIIRELDPDLAEPLRVRVVPHPKLFDMFAEFVLEFYYLRSAERIAIGFGGDFDRIRVGHAMAASACFPPVFPPFLVFGIYDELAVARLGLTDGGVYDNMGITALLDEGCTAVIASDTGGTFNEMQHSPTNQLGLSLRLPDIMMRALGGTQRQALRDRRRTTRAIAPVLPDPPPPWSEVQLALDEFRAGQRLDELAYFHTAFPKVSPFLPDAKAHEPPPIDTHLDPLDVARIRTDLDGFGETEIDVLVNHGYDMADRYVRRHLAALDVHGRWPATPIAPPKPIHDRSERLGRILVASRSRFFRALKLRIMGGPLGTPVSWTFSAAAALAAVWAVWHSGLSLVDVLRGIASFGVAAVARLIDVWIDVLIGVPLRALHRLIPAIPDPAWPPLSRQPVLFALLVALALVAFLFSQARSSRFELRSGKPAGARRLGRRISTWMRAYSGNVLWVLWGLPAILAAGTSLLAAVSYVFYHLPFMRATRRRGGEGS